MSSSTDDKTVIVSAASGQDAPRVDEATAATVIQDASRHAPPASETAAQAGGAEPKPEQPPAQPPANAQAKPAEASTAGSASSASSASSARIEPGKASLKDFL